MIEKINNKYYEKVAKPNKTVISIVNSKLEYSEALRVMEIGVGVGATSIEIYKLLSECDELYLLDFEEKVIELQQDLYNLYKSGANIVALGNSRKLLDSYAWSIMRLVKENIKFDIVFLDGAHNFIFDGIVCSLIHLLLNDDGYFIVDDVTFRMKDLIDHNRSKEKNINQLYTEEQIFEKQLERALECYIYTNPCFEEVNLPNSNTKVFRKGK